MSRMDDLRQGGTPFDGFLYAELGQDDAGRNVSMLSVLARLGLDPWIEAAELTSLSRDKARDRLSIALARAGEMSTLVDKPVMTVSRLLDLLPSAAPGIGKGVNLPDALKTLATGRTFAILIVVLFLLQTFFLGSNDSGN